MYNLFYFYTYPISSKDDIYTCIIKDPNNIFPDSFLKTFSINFQLNLNAYVIHKFVNI